MDKIPANCVKTVRKRYSAFRRPMGADENPPIRNRQAWSWRRNFVNQKMLSREIRVQMALAFPVLRIDRLEWVKSIRVARSPGEIFRSAVIRSSLNMMLIVGFVSSDRQIVFFLKWIGAALKNAKG